MWSCLVRVRDWGGLYVELSGQSEGLGRVVCGAVWSERGTGEGCMWSCLVRVREWGGVYVGRGDGRNAGCA